MESPEVGKSESREDRKDLKFPSLWTRIVFEVRPVFGIVTVNAIHPKNPCFDIAIIFFNETLQTIWHK